MVVGPLKRERHKAASQVKESNNPNVVVAVLLVLAPPNRVHFASSLRLAGCPLWKNTRVLPFRGGQPAGGVWSTQ